LSPLPGAGNEPGRQDMEAISPCFELGRDLRVMKLLT
jgi:hypothetical protein